MGAGIAVGTPVVVTAGRGFGTIIEDRASVSSYVVQPLNGAGFLAVYADVTPAPFPSTVQSGVPMPTQVIQLADASGNPVDTAGVLVTATASPAGLVLTNASKATGPDGRAVFNALTLTGTPGAYTLTFAATGLTSAISSVITVTASSAARLLSNSVTIQTAAVGSAVTTPPSVLVTDANGNPISGVSVTFAVGLGGGSVTGASQTTNASGVATVGSWTLGLAGQNTLVATASGLLPVLFVASATVGAATKLVLQT
jgi:adhesin/invasin